MRHPIGATREAVANETSELVVRHDLAHQLVPVPRWLLLIPVECCILILRGLPCLLVHLVAAGRQGNRTRRPDRREDVHAFVGMAS